MRFLKLSMMGLIAALLVPATLSAQDETHPLKRPPHPTMVAFVQELENGQLEQAATRIASVNDMFGRQRAYEYFTQAELVALLSRCELVEHTSLKTAVSTEKTLWDCPGGVQYSMIFNHVGKDANPYLYVGRVQTETARKALAEKMRRKFESGAIPPPLALRATTNSEPRAEYEARKRRENADEARKREALGQAVLAGQLGELTAFTSDETDVAYITHDPFFDVKIKHVNGFGMADARAVFERAFAELGKPVSFECYLPSTKWAAHRCEWELDAAGNRLYAEMNFKGEGGSMNSIRVYRSTPEETARLRQQALSLGVLES